MPGGEMEKNIDAERKPGEPRMNWTPAKMGKKGGKAKGLCKIRGDSAYYQAIVAKRGDRAKDKPDIDAKAEKG
jgi:hypothetical protein